MRIRAARTASALLVLLACARAGSAQEAIRYTLSFPHAANHYVEVEAVYPTGGQPQIDLMMAVWTPGSYLVREYARNVERVAAAAPDGSARPVTKTSKNHWRVSTSGAAAIRLTYRVYSREMGVRTNWVEARYAHLAGAATFITLGDGLARPHRVTLALPATWATAISGLAAGDAPHTFVAPNFDVLVDSPIVAGNPAVHEFTVGGKPHLLVNVNEPRFWDVQQSVGDLQKIVEACLRLWGELPYERYIFLNVLNEASGGLEHHNSTTMMASRWATRSRRRYFDWLGLASHEYFHTWNVKRMRPVELGPFNYDAENYTRGLWVSEGVTDYYGTLMLRRANILSDDAYLAQLSDDIETLQTTPGRLVQPVELASFDAWIKEYREDENSPNVAISYYTKGAIIGFLLDARIRRATANRRSLDDVMRAAYKRFSGARGFTSAEFRQLISEVAGTDLSDWLRRALETTEELDYREALDWYGLQFTTGPRSRRPGVIEWEGLRLRDQNNRLVVSEVRRNTPAYESGINAEDEIVALDDYRVRPDQWDARTETYRIGETVSVLVARRDELMRFDLKLAPPPQDEWQLRTVPDITAAQRESRQAWLAPAP
jgi:predicted metalloprotease with PDZ domain